MGSTKVRRGEVWWVRLDPTVGSEAKKTRPCLVVQRDSANAVSPTTLVCPLTAARGDAGDILNVIVKPGVSGLPKVSRISCNQVRVVDFSRFDTRIGEVDPTTLAEVGRGLRAILDFVDIIGRKATTRGRPAPKLLV